MLGVRQCLSGRSPRRDLLKNEGTNQFVGGLGPGPKMDLLV